MTGDGGLVRDHTLAEWPSSFEAVTTGAELTAAVPPTLVAMELLLLTAPAPAPGPAPAPARAPVGMGPAVPAAWAVEAFDEGGAA